MENDDQGDPPTPEDEEGGDSAAAGEVDGVDAERGRDVFEGVYGHDGAKTVVSAALRGGDTHVLFEGPPGSGKSALLLALESNVPGVMYRDGDQITAAKLRDVLKSDPPILLIDEIDALDNDAYDVLSTPMEHGRLVRDSARESYDVDVGTQVIAACNHREELPEHIQSRFRVLAFEPYDENEYIEVCAKMLSNEIDWVESESQARSVAKKVKEVTGQADPREARDTAQMATSFEEIDELARALHEPDADIDAGPLRPEDIARAVPEVGKERLRETLAEEMVRHSRERADGGDGDEPDPEEVGSPASNPGEKPGKHTSPAARPDGSGRDGVDEAIEDDIESVVEDAVT
ncbi:ATP-binding protein [Natronomonas sp.]|uniref:ATP-binding protein n=1 Tax=Natronomonas sp. TaxID=2184060 RepID=UPI002FC2E27D